MFSTTAAAAAINEVTRLDRLPPPIGPTDIAWISGLIARDVNNIRTAKTSSAKRRLKRAKNALKAVIHRTDSREVDAITSATEALHQVEASVEVPQLKTKKSLHMKKMSASTGTTFQSTINPSVFTQRRPNSPNSVNTDATEPPPLPEHSAATKTMKSTSTSPYELLRQQLRIWYKTRPHGLDDHAERWKNRGMYLVLQMALDNSVLNSTFGAKPGSLKEEEFMARVQDIISGLGNLPLSIVMSSDVEGKISRSPTKPYGNSNIDAVRIDSAHSTSAGPGACWPYNKTENGDATTPLTPEELYVAMLVAATDKTTTYTIVEALLHESDPNMDVEEFLTRIGDPTWRLEEPEDSNLRADFQKLLFPTYDTLHPIHKKPTLEERIVQAHPGHSVEISTNTPSLRTP